ncbi:TA system antitoxin ParD family protein [Ningiella sp. W23]|uniref:TA system antitoxin ParD family protein n=1 Tax=Ningiella sp. W23 TaxID=3023715 RepID=UPI003757660C
MAKHTSPMRLNADLVDAAKTMSALQNRSTAQQIEYWAELGKRVSAELTPAQTIQIMTGIGELKVEIPDHAALDVLALANEVEADSQSGRLSKELLKQGQTLYSPTPEGGGILEAHLPDGTVKTGSFVDGEFKPLRKQTLAKRA